MPVSAFSTVFDAAVLGGGHAGFAAVLALRQQGLSVLWLAPQAALLWEGGWAFAETAGDCALPAWRGWVEGLQGAGAARLGRIDGAVAEVACAALVRREGVAVLSYAWPYAAACDAAGRLAAVAVATKSGPRRIAARRWIDASDDGALLRLVADAAIPAPAARRIHIHLRRHAWSAPEAGLAPGLRWCEGLWAGERRLEVGLAPGQRPWSAWVPALDAARAALGAELDDAVVTHGSCVPWTEWTGGAAVPAGLPANLALAVPAFAAAPVASLGDRFALGHAAAARLAGLPVAADAGAAVPAARTTERSADVVVAGAGTGGALAAIAAARQGARTLAIDPLPFAGGIGTGGGIHVYYYGLRGGLQDELDARVRALMPRFGAAAQVSGFHPDAKKCALHAWMEECGVEQVEGQPASVRAVAGRVVAAEVAVAGGALAVAAPAWVDGTGDGDLAALAGARWAMGREGDGLCHAFSQSSGRASLADGKAKLWVVNYDQGFTDPTDAEDLTRARLLGIAQLEQERYEAEERPTYIAPALGLRQARHITTAYQLTLDDLVQRRRFPDAVAATVGHYDNHAMDYHFESAEGMFWVWACAAWSTPMGAEIPLRALEPQGIANLWLASRCLGVSQDAHHLLRMQRDMQRIGEAAGVAAALCARTGAAPAGAVRGALAASGALAPRGGQDGMGYGDLDWERIMAGGAPLPVDGLIAALRAGGHEGAVAMWRLYRARGAAEAAVLALVGDADAPTALRAAAVAAMWGSPAAVPRLRRALLAGEDHAIAHARGDQPGLPWWRTAISLLRLCAGPAALPDLLAAARRELPAAGLNLRCELALAAAGCLGRGAADAGQRAAAADLLALIEAGPLPADAARSPRRDARLPAQEPHRPNVKPCQPVRDDAAWQLRLAANRLRAALGLPGTAAAADRDDPRLPVRRAMLPDPAARKAVGAAAAAVG